MLPQHRSDFQIIWTDELIKNVFGDHWPPVVAHILAESHKVRGADREEFMQRPQMKIPQVGTNQMNKLRLVIIGIKMIFDSQ